MGIRDTTYYERQFLLNTFQSPLSGGAGFISRLIGNAFTDISGNAYVIETDTNGNFVSNCGIRKSSNAKTSLSATWSNLTMLFTGTTYVAKTDSSGNFFAAYTITTGSTPSIMVDKSTDFGASWTNVYKFYGSSMSTVDIDISENVTNQDHVAVGFAYFDGVSSVARFAYTKDHGSTWLTQSSIYYLNKIKFGKLSSSLYHGGGLAIGVFSAYGFSLYSSSFNVGTGLYSDASTLILESDVASANKGGLLKALDAGSDGYVYALFHSQSSTADFDGVKTLTLYTASNGRTFGKSAVFSFSGSQGDSLFVDERNVVYVSYVNNNRTFLTNYSKNNTVTFLSWSVNEVISFCNAKNYRDSLFSSSQFFMISSLNFTSSFDSNLYLVSINATSSSLGPAMFATSIGYQNPSAYPGTSEVKFKLNNVSEFPHSNGVFQMKNIILGTRDSGKIGNTDDAIIKINHIGSVVKVMWPKQDSIIKPIKGFGDFSAGERSGKLSTAFQPGEEMDVTPYDHVCLYGYLSKEASGTLDDVVITVERKPTTDNAFTIDQSVSYSLSGSKTETRLTDIEYKKEIDYGDLSINKIGFPIDVPLTNTKVMRVSVKQRLGQSNDLNKNFILWGRFIKSSKDTNET